MTSLSEALMILVLNSNVGTAAYCITSAPSTVSCRLGMCALTAESSSLLERSKESGDFAPNFGAAGESAPVRANQTDQLVALIDGNEVILSRSVAADMTYAV